MDTTAMRPLISATELTDVAVCRAELVAIGVGRGWFDARELEVVRRLDELAETDYTVFPQGVVADASKTSLTAAGRLRDRAGACDVVPELGDALSAGVTSGDRIDIVAKATVGLNASELALLATKGQRLAAAAAAQTATAFRKTVEHIVRQVRQDDGLAMLERQTRMARLKWFTDSEGMWCLTGRFDPATGARLEGKLRNAINRQFANKTPDNCPIDPVEKQQHLAALAFAAMLLDEDTAIGSSAPDVTVLIDAQTLLSGRAHEDTVCDIGLGRFGLPIETIRRWACIGTITPVVVAADGVRIMLGRETRIANRHQRRALRVLYRSCAMCDVPFDHCQVHHVSWYSLDGLTDIDNLIPICNRHHHLAHEGGWQLHLAPDRTLTITQPGGTINTHGPPTIRAA